MKKHFFWLVLGASALTACTSSDVVEEGPQSNAIRFENVINKNSRTEVTGDLTMNALDHFQVFGYYTLNGTVMNVFNGVAVNRDLADSNSAWDYTDTRYWMPDASYFFYAYSCAGLALSDTHVNGTPVFNYNDIDSEEELQKTKRGLKLVNYRCNADHQHDLICAVNEGYVARISGNTAVTLTFKHALSKISAEFVNDLPKGYQMSVSDVEFSNFYSLGSYDLRLNEWSSLGNDNLTDEKISVEVPQNNVANSTNDANSGTSVASSSAFFIPAKYTDKNLNIAFTLSLTQDGKKLLDRRLVGSWQPEWVPGYGYKYVIHITGDVLNLEAIAFEASQILTDPSWTEQTPTNISFGVVF